MRKDAKVEYLRHVPLFARCSKKELQELASIADIVDLPEGKALTREGTAGREFIVIVHGTADVRRNGRKLRSLSSGDWLGEIALITGAPRTATVTTTTPTQALVIRGTSFRTLLQHSPSIVFKLLEGVAAMVPTEHR